MPKTYIFHKMQPEAAVMWMGHTDFTDWESLGGTDGAMGLIPQRHYLNGRYYRNTRKKRSRLHNQPVM